MEPTTDEIKGWLQHPVTQYHIKNIKEAKEAIKENWATGMYTHESSEGTAQRNAEALGSVKQLEEILTDLEFMAEETEDET